ncbi:Phenylalanine--tRNA ligase beta subunit [Anaerotruncus sp. 2789STDY5834896]|uniref:Phenylalanine--tRNA ligase beta subunit n=1 Tax=uncultured Anaerotruncus sp. TaxID=905011 RepID=A0A1C6K1H6_9FIRM|nr:Phenylalanine--tRNA ligase beta subunit [uncultured Anaerotruncus sp.]
MILSYKWLQDYTEIDAAPRAYAEAMSMSGSKVEGWENLADEIKNVVVGKVLSIEKHPDADKLVVCQVEVGGAEPIQICTGATNLYPGAVVPVALHDSYLPGGVHIKKGKLRGQVSNGMMCSFAELGLTEHDCPDQDADGIMILKDGSYTVGEDIVTALELDDLAVEFEITSNRPDCLSMIGLARESAATFRKPLRLPDPRVEHESGDIGDYLKVDVETENCLRYAAKVVKNVKIGPSPKWMRDRLRVCGIRPISNIVDITNYVLLEYGSPMHAFDYQQVENGHIIVRQARPGETLETLDGVVRHLDETMMVIADEQGPSVVAGVMGGEKSGIADDTTTIIFESACFAGPSVRRTSKKLGLRTESSSRYEKGLDPETCISALLRACQLVEQLGAGEVVGGVIDCYPAPKAPTVLHLDVDYTNRFLGTEIPKEDMVKYLESLEFEVRADDSIVVPSFRADVAHKADVAEEIARLYGYDKIPSTLAQTADEAELTREQKFARTIRQQLVGMGLYEIITYTFISPKYYDNIRLPADSPLRDSVTIRNPLGEDTSVMRTTALPSMLDILSKNYANRNLSCRLFELATVYEKAGDDQLPNEPEHLTLGMYGDCDFYTIKGVCQGLLDGLKVPGCRFIPCADHPTFHPGRCAEIELDGKIVGVIGEVYPEVAAGYGIKPRTYIAELDIASLLAGAVETVTYKPLPKFPASTRDLALVCNEEILVGDITESIQHSAGKLLEKVEFFDIYRGKQLPEGKKSVAFKIVLRSENETLTDKHADDIVAKILKNLAPLGVSLRA